MIENRVIREARIFVWDSQVFRVGEGTQRRRQSACEMIVREVPATITIWSTNAKKQHVDDMPVCMGTYYMPQIRTQKLLTMVENKDFVNTS